MEKNISKNPQQTTGILNESLLANANTYGVENSHIAENLISIEDALNYLIQQSHDISCKAEPVKFKTTKFCCQQKVPNYISDAFHKIIKVTNLKFNPDDIIHIRILQSIYSQITNSTEKIPIIDQRWEQIGFQTDNPIKDLRAAGLMGLIIPLALFQYAPSLSKHLFDIAIKSSRPFPLMLVLIVFASDAIYSNSNSDMLLGSKDFNEVWSRILYYFIGLVLELLKIWETKNLDFMHNYYIFEHIKSDAHNKARDYVKKGSSIIQKEAKN